MKVNYIDVGSSGGLTPPWKSKYINKLLLVDPMEDDSIPVCIFTDEEDRDFFVLRKHQCSSLFKPNYAFIESFFGRIENKYKTEKTIKVKCRRLDSILDGQSARYEFLKVDAQGADLHVIQSCGKYLDSLVGIHLEAHYYPFYEDIPLFGDIKKYLHSRGFVHYKTLMKKKWFGDFLFLNKNSDRAKSRFIKHVYRGIK